MRIAVIHSRYLSGDVSGENRVVTDEVALLRSAGHDVVTFEPSARVDEGSLVLARDAIWSTRSVKQVVALSTSSSPMSFTCIRSTRPSPRPSSGATFRFVMTLHNARLLCLPATLIRDSTHCELCLGKTPWRGVVHACYRGSRPASAAMGVSLGLHRALRTFERVTLFLAVSDFVRAKHIEAGFEPGRIRVKPNFVRPAKRRIGAGGSFVVLGRLTSEKGIDTLLRGWEGAPLDIVGEGSDRPMLERMAPASVRFRGVVDAGDIPDLLAGARALLIPSRSEGLPRVVIEAFAAGVPVVASRVGGLPELVEHDVNGLLVDLDDQEGWRAASARLGDDRESLRLGDGAFSTWQERFTPELGLSHLERAYSDAMGLWKAHG